MSCQRARALQRHGGECGQSLLCCHPAVIPRAPLSQEEKPELPSCSPPHPFSARLAGGITLPPPSPTFMRSPYHSCAPPKQELPFSAPLQGRAFPSPSLVLAHLPPAKSSPQPTTHPPSTLKLGGPIDGGGPSAQARPRKGQGRKARGNDGYGGLPFPVTLAGMARERRGKKGV